MIRVKTGFLAARVGSRTIEKAPGRTPALERRLRVGDRRGRAGAGEEEAVNSTPRAVAPQPERVAKKEARLTTRRARRAETQRVQRDFADEGTPSFDLRTEKRGTALPARRRSLGDRDGTAGGRRRRRGAGRGGAECSREGQTAVVHGSDAPVELPNPWWTASPPERPESMPGLISKRHALRDRGGPPDRGGVDRPAPFSAHRRRIVVRGDDRRGEVKATPSRTRRRGQAEDAIFRCFDYTRTAARRPPGARGGGRAARSRGGRDGQARSAPPRATTTAPGSLGLRPRFRIAGTPGVTDGMLDPSSCVWSAIF